MTEPTRDHESISESPSSVYQSAGVKGEMDLEKESPAHLTIVDDSSLVEIEPALDRAITRKLDTHVVPWLFGLWLLAFIDRSNIGNAKIDGLVTDLKLGGNTFNIALALFYVPYILVDIPSNWFLKVRNTEWWTAKNLGS